MLRLDWPKVLPKKTEIYLNSKQKLTSHLIMSTWTKNILYLPH